MLEFHEKYGASHFLLEQELIGDEFGAQAIICNGEVVAVMIYDDVLFELNGTRIPVAHVVPSVIESKVYELVLDQIKVLIGELDLGKTMLNLDFIDTASGPVLLEVGCRGGGTCLMELLGAC